MPLNLIAQQVLFMKQILICRIIAFCSAFLVSFGSMNIVFAKASLQFAQEIKPANTTVQAEPDVRLLELGKPIERELKGGQIHTYQLTLSLNQFLRVVADQRGIDVVVRLFGPDSKLITEVDSPNGTQGPEPVSVVSDAAGSYRLEVRSLEKDAPAGRYEIKIEEIRSATAQDRMRISAERGLAQAEQLRSRGTAESSRKAISKYEEVLPVLRSIGDRRIESTALNSIGLVYNSLGETRKALDYYNQALPMLRSVGDKRIETATLNNIGRAYDTLG